MLKIVHLLLSKWSIIHKLLLLLVVVVVLLWGHHMGVIVWSVAVKMRNYNTCNHYHCKSHRLHSFVGYANAWWRRPSGYNKDYMTPLQQERSIRLIYFFPQLNQAFSRNRRMVCCESPILVSNTSTVVQRLIGNMKYLLCPSIKMTKMYVDRWFELV